MILIGYSGHAYVVQGILKTLGKTVHAYCDTILNEKNPFNLDYLGSENSENAINELYKNEFFISIGNNHIRRKVYENLTTKNLLPINAIDSSAIICQSAIVANHGVMIGAGAIINALSKIGDAAICNTGCIIEHECEIGEFSHICPGTILCGNVTVGFNTFVGAGSVVKQGVIIGNNVTIGAGSVVINNIPDNAIVFGNPAKLK
ncbi:MAG: acetyltransferase [Ferruginibacter sp.]|nr:acetyltransferase [Ferruginibacter sp.]